MNALAGMPKAVVATDAEVLALIDRHALSGRGIGYIDVHLLAAVQLTGSAALWTRDKRLHTIATALGLAMTRP